MGGVPVNTFDFVLQSAQTRFVDADGVETLDAPALNGLRMAISHLDRIINSGAPAVALANWDAFIASLK